MPSENRESPAALAPEYVCEVNEPILLHDGDCILVTAKGDVPGHCQIHYSWYPTSGPELFFRPTSSSPALLNLALDDRVCALRVTSIGLDSPVLILRTTYNQEGLSMRGILNGRVEMGDGQRLSKILFHVPNFPTVHGPSIEMNIDGRRRIINGRTHLENDPWVVDIDPVPNHGTSTPFSERLKDLRGYGVTHVGVLRRLDNGPFSVEDAENNLGDVGWTLSFARAAMTFPMLRVGFNAGGDRVWRCWSGYHNDAWHTNSTWFSAQQPEVLQSVFTGWRRLSSDPNGEIIHAALGLYLDANMPGLTSDSKLVLVQAALEGLADGWPYGPLPNAPRLTGFNPGKAAERIAKIAVSLGLPIQVPSELKELVSLQQLPLNTPGLEKMTWVRNSIAHLGKYPRLSGTSNTLRYQAYLLGTWHLELALLRLLDAKGVYQNRLTVQWAGEVHPLPWVASGSVV